MQQTLPKFSTSVIIKWLRHSLSRPLTYFLTQTLSFVLMFKKTKKGWRRKQGFHLPMQADIPSSLSLPTCVGVFGEALDEACCVVLLEVLNGHRKTLVDFEQL